MRLKNLHSIIRIIRTHHCVVISIGSQGRKPVIFTLLSNLAKPRLSRVNGHRTITTPSRPPQTCFAR